MAQKITLTPIEEITIKIASNGWIATIERDILKPRTTYVAKDFDEIIAFIKSEADKETITE